MRKRNPATNQDGFSLVEMIGVLAVIGILAALILPRVLAIITDSKVNAVASALKTYETAVTKYYADVGNILPLNAAGNPQNENGGNSATVRSLPARLTLPAEDPLVLTTGLWPKFRGPYLEKFITATPPALGTNVFMPARTPVAYGTATTGNNLGWDLNGDGSSDIPTTARVVYVRLTGLGQEDFLKLDQLVDPDIGTDSATKMVRGRAKYHAASQTLYAYIAHK